MNGDLITGIIVGIVICVWNIYLVLRIETLNMRIKTMPTPEQLAKQIINMKIPIDELPLDLQEKAFNMVQNTKLAQQPKSLTSEKNSYIG